MKKEFTKRLLSTLTIVPISLFFIIKGSIFFIFFLGVIFLITSYEWLNMTKKFKVFKIFGICFLFLSFFLAYQLHKTHGFNFFLFIILISVSTDIGGYIFGKSFKGPKLTKISPNKTYTGVLGSFIISLVSCLFYLKYSLNTILWENFNQYKNIFDEYNLFLLITIMLLSLISQLGDLTISYFKRLAKIKNTGNIIPGHGGLLDRIDGIIFTIPSSYIILNFIIY